MEPSKHREANGSRDQCPDSRLVPRLFAGAVLIAFAGGKIYFDRHERAVAQQPGARSSPPEFDLRRTIIPREEIRRGGPAKDGIPALSDPESIAKENARYLRPEDRVVGVVIEGEARAYPLRILSRHEVVNDMVQKRPIAVTYCPLCDSVAVFDRQTPDGVREFGVSGRLYNSNVLMYDRGGRPEGLWSQLKAKAVSGPSADQGLKTLPVELTTWADWRSRHPETKVLSNRTGYPRDYSKDPYAGYFDRAGLMFPARPSSDRLPEKAKVLGVWAPDGTAKAYPLSAFVGVKAPRDITEKIQGLNLTLHFDPRSQSLRVVQADRGLHWMYSLWFAWYAFHSNTELFTTH